MKTLAAIIVPVALIGCAQQPKETKVVHEHRYVAPTLAKHEPMTPERAEALILKHSGKSDGYDCRAKAAKKRSAILADSKNADLRASYASALYACGAKLQAYRQVRIALDIDPLSSEANRFHSVLVEYLLSDEQLRVIRAEFITQPDGAPFPPIGPAEQRAAAVALARPSIHLGASDEQRP